MLGVFGYFSVVFAAPHAVPRHNGIIHFRGAPGGKFMIPQSQRVGENSGLNSRKGRVEPRLLSYVDQLGNTDLTGAESRVQIVVHTQHSALNDVRQRLSEAFNLSDAIFVPNSALCVFVPRGRVSWVSRVPGVVWVGHMRPEWKYEPESMLDASLRRGGHAYVVARLVAPSPTHALRATMAEIGVGPGALLKRQHGGSAEIHVRVPTRLLDQTVRALSLVEAVHWVGVRYPAQIHNLQAARSVLGEAMHVSGDSPVLPGIPDALDGSGQVIGVHDTGLDTGHCFFMDATAGPVKRCHECNLTSIMAPSRALAVRALNEIRELVCNETLLDTAIVGSSSYCPTANLSQCRRSPPTHSLGYYMRIYMSVATGNETYRATPSADLVSRYCPKFNVTSATVNSTIRGLCCQLVDSDGPPPLPPLQRALAKALKQVYLDCCLDSPTYYNSDFRPGNASCTMESAECTTPQSAQRKVRAYWAFNDDGDRAHGHGTHVCGTLAGRAGSPVGSTRASQYGGLASAATIVFSDASDKHHGGVFLPKDIVSPMRWAYSMGARVHSNSWGNSRNRYTLETAELDHFVYAEAPDMLVLFAAGNDGAKGYGSLGSHANGKNIVVVGAAGQPLAYEYASAINASRHQGRASVSRTLCGDGTRVGPKQALLDDMNRVLSNVCGVGGGTDAIFPTATSVADYFCPRLAPDNETRWREFCCRAAHFNYSVAAEAGFSGECREGLRRLYFLGHTSLDFSSCCYDTKRLEAEVEQGLVGERIMAPFSSRGPTADGRLKPDVVGPGFYIVSARAGDPESAQSRCQGGDAGGWQGLIAKAGTSMSTPVVASAAAIIRQYFVEGYHASGRVNTSAAMSSPSSALLRATLVAATVPLGGAVRAGNAGNGTCSATHAPCYFNASLADLPPRERSFVGGHGFLHLPAALWFEGGTFRLYAFDNASLGLQTNQTFVVRLKFKRRADGTARHGRLRAVLAWTDPPASPASSRTLVNDLDLVVRNRNRVAPGNAQKLAVDGSNSDAFRDRFNNLEEARLPVAPDGDSIEVRVEAAGVRSTTAQSFALVLVCDPAASIQVSIEPLWTNEAGRTTTSFWSASRVGGLVVGLLALALAIGVVCVWAWRRWRRARRVGGPVGYAMHEILPSFDDLGDESEPELEYEYDADTVAADRVATELGEDGDDAL